MSITKTFTAPTGDKIFKDINREKRTIQAYYSAFNNVDSDGDIARPGMTLKSIKETGPSSARPRIKHFLNHDITLPISRLTEMGEDNHGPWYAGEIGVHKGGRDFLDMAESGLITEHSYMGRPTRVRKAAEGRELLEMQVMEVSSLTHWGANGLTPIIAMSKSMDKDQLLKCISDRIQSIEKFCRNTDASDDTIESLLIFIKQMEQHVVELTSTTPAVEETPEPRTQNFGALLAEIQSISKTFKA